MQIDSQNKAMDSAAIENKTVQPTTIRAVSQLESEYFYPASNGYQAISVRAATKADADAIYVKRRQPVTAPQEEQKVEVSKETNEQ